MIDSLFALFLGCIGVVFCQEVLLVRQNFSMLLLGWRQRDWFLISLMSACLVLALVFGVACVAAVLEAINNYTSLTVPLGSVAAGAAGYLFGYAVPLFKYASHGEMLPRGYGIAWVDYANGRLTCMPVPLNVVVRWFRLAWLWIKYAGMTFPATSREAFDAGYRQAVKDAQDNL